MVVGGVTHANRLRAEGRPALAVLTGTRCVAKERGAALRWDLIAAAALRARSRVLLPERIGDDLRFQHAAEQLATKAPAAEAAIEVLVHAVLPRAARLDEVRRYVGLRQPFLQCQGHELTPVLAPQVPSGSVHPDRRLQRPDCLRGTRRPRALRT
jgi:hypothetical protein